MRTELHIGIDTEKIVVAPYPLKLRTGRARRRRDGSVTEVLPLEPSGRSREVRLTFAARVSLPLIFLSAGLFALGLPWWPAAAATGAVLGLIWRRQAQAARPGTFALPRDDEGRVLRSPEERAAFDRAVVVSRRVRRTWPALPDMIDPVVADRALTRALDDLATLMTRRQEIRRLRAELSGVRRQDVPADSPAVAALATQRDRVEQLWLETGDEANRILRSINAAALAGETFLREQEIGETARAAELVLAELTVGAPPAGTGPELADRTEAVISAYRELAAAGPR
ncbi:hypothetical protein ACWKSP_06770 [Micromonosporaceae bacterium Da 78-11]